MLVMHLRVKGNTIYYKLCFVSLFFFSLHKYRHHFLHPAIWDPVFEQQVCLPTCATSSTKICNTEFVLASFVYIYILSIYYPLGGIWISKTANSKRRLAFFKLARHAWYMKQRECFENQPESCQLGQGLFFEQGNVLIFVLYLTKQKQSHLLWAMFSRL